MVTVLCQHCSSALEIPSGTDLFTCISCGSHLRLRTGGGAHYTEEVEDLRQAEALISLDAHIETLDLSWNLARRALLTRAQLRLGLNPHEVRPYPISSIIFLILSLGVVTYFVHPSHRWMPIAGILIALIIYTFVNSRISARARIYAEAENQYLVQRERLMRRAQPDSP